MGSAQSIHSDGNSISNSQFYENDKAKIKSRFHYQDTSFNSTAAVTSISSATAASSTTTEIHKALSFTPSERALDFLTNVCCSSCDDFDILHPASSLSSTSTSSTTPTTTIPIQRVNNLQTPNSILKPRRRKTIVPDDETFAYDKTGHIHGQYSGQYNNHGHTHGHLNGHGQYNNHHQEQEQDANMNNQRRSFDYIPLHNFDLDMVHPAQPPYLGTCYWQDEEKEHTQEEKHQQTQEHEQQIHQNCDSPNLAAFDPNQNLLDISNIAQESSTPNRNNAHDNYNDNNTFKHYHGNEEHDNESTHTYPQQQQRYNNQQLNELASPTFLLSNADDFSTPRLYRIRSNGNGNRNGNVDYEDNDNTSLRTATTTSTDCSSSNKSKNGNANQQQVFVSFTPRRLFGYCEEEEEGLELLQHEHSHDNDNDNDNQNYNCEHQEEDDEGSSSSFQIPTSTSTSTHYEHQHEYSNETPLSSPKPNRTSSNYDPPEPLSPNHDSSSIILRNGILTKTLDASSSTLSSSTTTPIIQTPTKTISPCRSASRSIPIPTSSQTLPLNFNNLSSSSSVQSVDTRYIPDGGVRVHKEEKNGYVSTGTRTSKLVNTLPSIQPGVPIRLKIVESYADFSSNDNENDHDNHRTNEEDENDYDEDYCHNNNGGNGNSNSNDRNYSFSYDAANGNVNTSNISMLSDLEQAHFFSYDPYFSLGQYIISTSPSSNPQQSYGNGLSVKLGEQYMTLQDKEGLVYAVTRSRHTFIPSCVIYSPKPRFVGQTPSSHRPSTVNGIQMNNYHKHGEDGDGVELYPWALAKKEGRRIDHDVSVHLVLEPENVKSGEEMVGGLFQKRPTFISRHGFDKSNGHSHTVVYRIAYEEGGEEMGVEDVDFSLHQNDAASSGDGSGSGGRGGCSSTSEKKQIEIPCCVLLRDPIDRDVFDVTIAPGIDPLMIICYMAVHFKMDMEPKICCQ